ncbi:MAG: dUTP diphosphatase [Alphaproteobacteria bacterium]
MLSETGFHTYVGIKKLDERAILPEYAHSGDSGADLFSLEQIVIPKGKWAKVGTGIALNIPEGYEVQIRGKSGLALNYGIGLVNGIGTIDQGYKGELAAILINHGAEDYVVKAGSKIAQMVLCPVVRATFLEAELSESSRGIGGFGSTGLGEK